MRSAGPLDELVDAFADGTLSPADLARAGARGGAQGYDPPSPGGPGSYADAGDSAGEQALREAWESRGLSWRRAVLAAVVERVVPHSCLSGRNVFDPSRIEVVWRT